MKSHIKENLILKGHYRFTLRDTKTGKVRTYEAENVVTTALKEELISQLFEAAESSDILITYGLVGTGTNTPSAADTQLQTEIARTTIASLSSASTVGYATAFFSESEGNGTLKEAGIVFGGSASANTGTLISRVAINITKTSSETLTMDWSLTIS